MNKSFDYIVVGGGSAGCTLANRLSQDQTVSVLLLEAGQMDDNLLIRMPGGMLEIFQHGLFQWQMPSVPQAALNGRQLNTITGKVLGGSSSINAMLHIRGTAMDYDRWAHEYSCTGWAYKDVLPYFRSTETNKNGGNDQRGNAGELHVMSRDQQLPSGKVIEMFHSAALEMGVPARADFCDGVAEGVGWTQACIKDGQRQSASRAFIHPIMKKRSNLTIITNACAQKIHFAEGLGKPRACAVSYRHRGKTIRVNASREVVLAAGALRSPQLLQVSGIGSRKVLTNAGVKCLVDLPGVGENLHDHPTTKVQYKLNEPLSMACIGFLQKASIGLQWLLGKKGIASWHHFDANMFIRTAEGLDEPDIQIQMIPIIATSVEEGFINEHGVTFLTCLLAEKSRGSVKITSPDMNEYPEIDLGFLSRDEDLEPIVRGIHFIRQFAKAKAWGGRLFEERLPQLHVNSDEDLKAFIRQTVETDYHYGGTCRMGNPNDSGTVVDPRLRVKQVEGLRVADASIMPVPMHGNTNHACIMIGAKAADIIKADYR